MVDILTHKMDWATLVDAAKTGKVHIIYNYVKGIEDMCKDDFTLRNALGHLAGYAAEGKQRKLVEFFRDTVPPHYLKEGAARSGNVEFYQWVSSYYMFEIGTGLDHACARNDTKMIDYILSVNPYDSDVLRRALSRSLRAGHVEVFMRLEKFDREREYYKMWHQFTKTEYYDYLLKLAIECGQTTVFQYVYTCEKDDALIIINTLMGHAIFYNRLEILQFLIQRIQDLRFSFALISTTMFYTACRHDNLEMIKCILDYIDTFNDENLVDFYRYGLKGAAQHSLDIFKYLLKYSPSDSEWKEFYSVATQASCYPVMAYCIDQCRAIPRLYPVTSGVYEYRVFRLIKDEERKREVLSDELSGYINCLKRLRIDMHKQIPLPDDLIDGILRDVECL